MNRTPSAAFRGLLHALCFCAPCTFACAFAPGAAAQAPAPLVEELIDSVRTKHDAPSEYALGLRAWEGRGLARNAKQAFGLMERAAGKGHAEACNMMGYFYEHGIGTTGDTAQAFAWYRRGAEAGSARARTNLGWFYEQGIATEKDPNLAADWYAKAAGQGLPAAQYNLARLTAAGSGAVRDLPRAIELYKAAIAGGLALAGMSLGKLYEGQGELALASEQYVAAARAQVADAALPAGRLLLAAANPRHDAAAGVHWLEDAAGRGSIDALLMLANLYDKGDKGSAVQPDPAKAAEYFRRAAVHGDRESAFRTGAYAEAHGRDPEPWYWQAAVQGHPEAEYRLARLRQARAGGDKAALHEAAGWYRKSAEQGNTAAALQLGIMLEGGLGADPAPAEALAWYQKAAAANDPEALYRLGNLYDRGRGTAPDYARARDYYSRAAALGHKEAARVLEKMIGVPPLEGILNDTFKGMR